MVSVVGGRPDERGGDARAAMSATRGTALTAGSVRVYTIEMSEALKVSWGRRGALGARGFWVSPCPAPGEDNERA